MPLANPIVARTQQRWQAQCTTYHTIVVQTIISMLLPSFFFFFLFLFFLFFFYKLYLLTAIGNCQRQLLYHKSLNFTTSLLCLIFTNHMSFRCAINKKSLISLIYFAMVAYGPLAKCSNYCKKLSRLSKKSFCNPTK
jgi:hypothetical protein